MAQSDWYWGDFKQAVSQQHCYKGSVGTVGIMGRLDGTEPKFASIVKRRRFQRRRAIFVEQPAGGCCSTGKVSKMRFAIPTCAYSFWWLQAYVSSSRNPPSGLCLCQMETLEMIRYVAKLRGYLRIPTLGSSSPGTWCDKVCPELKEFFCLRSCSRSRPIPRTTCNEGKHRKAQRNFIPMSTLI